jgi:hypothetical protein
MIKLLSIFFIISLITSCKYRENKASYSIIEMDSTMIDNESDWSDSSDLDSVHFQNNHY